MGADRLVGIADRDRSFDAEIEHFAAVRPRLVGVAPHVELLRRAADIDRDRLDRELGVERRLGKVGLFGRGRLGGVLGGGGVIELRLRLGHGGIELRRQFHGLGGHLRLQVRRFRFGLVALGVGKQLVGISKIGVGAGLLRLQLAQRYIDRRGIVRRQRRGFLGVSGRLAASAISRATASARVGAAARAAALGWKSFGSEKSTGTASIGEMITRIPIRVLSNSFSA